MALVSEAAGPGPLFRGPLSPSPRTSLSLFSTSWRNMWGRQQWGDQQRDRQGQVPSPHPYPLPKPFAPAQLRGGRGLLRIHSCSGAHELCTGARSICQHPVREESKAPAAGRQLSLCGEAATWLSRPAEGPPCEPFARAGGALGALLPAPLQCPVSLFLCQAQI